MGKCLCLPKKGDPHLTSTDLQLDSAHQLKFNHSGPKSIMAPIESRNTNFLTSPATNKEHQENINNNNDLQPEEIEKITTQIFVGRENEILNLEDIKQQSRIKIEDFTLLKVKKKRKKRIKLNFYSILFFF